MKLFPQLSCPNQRLTPINFDVAKPTPFKFLKKEMLQ
jgi:hypothetical protein